MYALKIVFSDNLTNSFTIQEIDDCQCVIIEGNEGTCILDNFFWLSTTSSTYPPKGKENSIMVYKFKNSLSEKQLLLIENLGIKSLTWFKHQINIIVAIFVLWKFIPSNQSFEWMEYWKYSFS